MPETPHIVLLTDDDVELIADALDMWISTNTDTEDAITEDKSIDSPEEMLELIDTHNEINDHVRVLIGRLKGHQHDGLSCLSGG